jgi:hypothetical protein
VDIEGSFIPPDPTINLDVDWGILHLKSAELTAQITTSAHASAAASGAASCSVGPVEIGEFDLPTIRFVVGPGIPVIIKPEIEVSLSGLGQVDASVSTSLDATVTAKAGARYEDGQLDPIIDFDHDFDYVPPEPQGNAKLSGTVTTELDLELYGAGGPELAFNGGLELNAALNADPAWTLDAPISITAGFEIDRLDIEAGPITVYEHTFHIAEAGSTTAGTRASLTWSDDSDLDLHVWDDQGNHAFYRNATAIPDTFLTTDDTNGFGPEDFVETADGGRRYTFGICLYSGDNLTATLNVTDPDGSQRTFTQALGPVKSEAVLATSPAGAGFVPPAGFCAASRDAAGKQ